MWSAEECYILESFAGWIQLCQVNQQKSKNITRKSVLRYFFFNYAIILNLLKGAKQKSKF